MTPSGPFILGRVPVGFKFAPPDYELIAYLRAIVYGRIRISDPLIAAGDMLGYVDVYKTEPWNIPVRFKYAVGTEAYYVTPRRPQHEAGKRAARRAGAGTWKASGTAREVEDEHGRVVGYVMQLCYVKEGERVSSGWIMNEYTLTAGREGEEFEKLVICKIKRNATTEKRMRAGEKITETRKKYQRADCKQESPGCSVMQESGQLLQYNIDQMALAGNVTVKQETKQVHDSKLVQDYFLKKKARSIKL